MAGGGVKRVRVANRARKRRIPLDGPEPTTLKCRNKASLRKNAASGIKILAGQLTDGT